MIKRALEDSRDITRLAIDAAQRELIERLNPTISSLVEQNLKDNSLGREIDGILGEDLSGAEIANRQTKDVVESVSSLFPHQIKEDITKMDDEEDQMDENVEEPVEEAACEENDIELSESELEEIYKEALQLEVDVSNGFRELQRPHELGAGAKGQYQTDPANLMQYKSGEHEWDGEAPPEKQDFTVKEIRQQIRRGYAENKALRKENLDLKETVKKVMTKLSEMNVLNSKILHVNKFLNAHSLTAEQKRVVIEGLDEAKSVQEVRSIFRVMESTFRAAGSITESSGRKPRADNQKRRTTGAPDQKVIRESAGAGNNREYSRWSDLAGLRKLTNG